VNDKRSADLPRSRPISSEKVAIPARNFEEQLARLRVAVHRKIPGIASRPSGFPGDALTKRNLHERRLAAALMHFVVAADPASGFLDF